MKIWMALFGIATKRTTSKIKAFLRHFGIFRCAKVIRRLQKSNLCAKKRDKLRQRRNHIDHTIHFNWYFTQIVAISFLSFVFSYLDDAQFNAQSRCFVNFYFTIWNLLPTNSHHIYLYLVYISCRDISRCNFIFKISFSPSVLRSFILIIPHFCNDKNRIRIEKKATHITFIQSVQIDVLC